MAARFVLKRSGSQFRFNLLAGNGRIILTSERYKSEAAALNGIKSVKRNGAKDARYDRRTSKAGDPYFVLKAPNGEPIGKSEMYSAGSAMERGIASVKKNAPGSDVVDLS